jgi:selenocysteine lyase/cysteine desulfurase/predicted metal-dependent enzyme (double-stranded beta helix superfamily)
VNRPLNQQVRIMTDATRNRLAPLLDYLESIPPGQRADTRELRRLLLGLDALRFEDFDPSLVFSDVGYTRLQLAGNDRYEVLLMGWKSGQQSPIHDHARSVCGARVLKGVASETTFRFTPSGHLLAEGTRSVSEGGVFLSQDGDMHLIANYEQQELCTLHVYSPPLGRMNQYRYDTGERADYQPETMTLDSLSAALAGPAGLPGTIYLNNAATTWPKPEVVYAAVNRALRAAGSLGRTAGTNVETPLEAARGRLASFLGIRDPKRLALVPGCTYACNIAIQALDWRPGDRILISGLEHNAVSRPVGLVAERHGLEYATAPYAPGNPMDLDWVEEELRKGGVRLVAAMMASNVTGEILPYRELRELTRRYGALLMLDAAQTGGVLPLSLDELQPDLCVFAGHKGFYGTTGVGMLYVAPGLEQQLFVVGGTGRDSGRVEMSRRMPDQFEVGTHNAMALAGLEAGVRWLEDTGVHRVLAHERALTARFVDGLRQRQDVHIYGGGDLDRRLGVVSVRFIGRDPREVGGWLAERGVVTRTGFHCAPLAHRTIGSLAHGGTVRFSFGWHNTTTEVDRVLELLGEMEQAVPLRAQERFWVMFQWLL